MSKRNVYLDHAATTPTDPRVVKAMSPYWTDKFANPSSIYRLGQVNKQAINEARQIIANYLASQPDEIIFTGGGTASINLAIKGLVEALNTKTHIITSNIEHHAVSHSVSRLANQGHHLSFLPVDINGLVSLADLKATINDQTRLVTIMMANNEIGTIQPIQKIGAYLAKLNQIRTKQKLPRIYFHTDACQAAGTLDLNVNKLHVDLLTLNGSKIYGPKGVGVLYVKRGTPLIPLLDGGGQEKNKRSGTENIPGIIGLAKAIVLAQQTKEKENKRLITLRDWFINQITTTIPKTILNGDSQNRLPNNINISFLDIEGEAILLHLDEVGIQVSTGSACNSESLEPSHVIRALGYPPEVAHGSIRFTLGKSTTKADLEYVLSKLPTIIQKLRKSSPVNLKMEEIIIKAKKIKREVLNF